MLTGMRILQPEETRHPACGVGRIVEKFLAVKG
jgi:hypothetical protein